MEFLYVLEKLRIPGLNELMLLITHLGEETAFLVIALIVFWCVDKRRGYYVMAVGFATTIFNQFIKLLCRVPRPWVLDENFTIVEQARAEATGYSFPSGHTQTAVGTFGALACTAERRWARRLFVAVAVLVPFSRMYLGVHTPSDVMTGAAISLGLVVALRPMAQRELGRGMTDILGALAVMAAGLWLFVRLYPFPEEVDAGNLESGVKNAAALLGCLVGMLIVYPVEKRWIRFETKAVWWAQILKVVLGLGMVLLVKEGLRTPLEALLPVYAARSLRYFLVVLAAGLLWPMTFRFFAGLGEKI